MSHEHTTRVRMFLFVLLGFAVSWGFAAQKADKAATPSAASQKIADKSGPAQTPVADKAADTNTNPNAAVVQEFEKRVADYVKLHKDADTNLSTHKSTEEPEKIVERQKALAGRIIAARQNAKQGDFFGPEISKEFHRLISITMQGPEAARIKQTIDHAAEPAQLKLAVNKPYPESVPLNTTPATLLMNLPKLPEQLDYRVVGKSLVLRDVEANLIIDYMPAAIP